MELFKNNKPGRYFKMLTWLIIALGIVLRLLVYFQNRNLIIDEANVARNIYERSFAGLLQPLSYEQYAPPVFLWVVKLFASVLGYGEYALRLYALLAGCGFLILFYFLLKRFVGQQALWYPLGLLVTSYMFIRFSSEVKPYMSDAFIALGLVLLALKPEVINKIKFALSWIIAGSIAIWASLPSVFVLAAVGIYYGLNTLRNKKYPELPLLVLVYAIWLGQFLLYYFSILRPQISSSYLQNYHHNDFMVALPENANDWLQNWNVFSQLLAKTGGATVLALAFNGLLLLYGGIMLCKKEKLKAVLVIGPILILLIASALHQYSMQPRLVLFAMVFVVFIVGYGFADLMGQIPGVAKVLAILIGIVCIWNNKPLQLFMYDAEKEYITPSLSFAIRHSISGNELYIHHGAVPAFIYYTQIHPGKDKWRTLRNAHLLTWDTNYDSLARQANGKAAFMFSNATETDRQNINAKIAAYLHLQSELVSKGYIYIYSK